MIDYRLDDWATLTYEKRRFFDWGGWLAVRPMDELPYWRVLMRRERESARWRAFAREHAAAIAEMRDVLHERGTVSNRDFTMSARTRVDSYRGRKDSAVALYYLWRMGEAMVTRRERFERVYAPTEAVAPADLIRESTDAEADDFLLRKMVAAQGLTKFVGVKSALQRDDLGRGVHDLARARGSRTATWSRSASRAGGARTGRSARTPRSSQTLEAGRVPRAWKPLDTTTEEEATFLSPLDPVARPGARSCSASTTAGRSTRRPPKRQYGYYVLPVLWRDTLVARFDAKLDRPERTLRILGLWLEDEALARDEAFAEAMARGMARFLGFLDADRARRRRRAAARLRRRLGAVGLRSGAAPAS